MDIYIYFSALSLFVIWRNSIKDIDIGLRKILFERNYLNRSNFRSVRPKIRRQKIAWKNFTRGILPWRAGGSVDWRWVACPSWPFRLHHPNILSTAFLKRFLVSTCYLQFLPLFLLRLRDSSSPLPSFLSLLKIPRTSHSSSGNSSVSGASRNVRWDSLYYWRSLLLQIFRNKSIRCFL